MDDCVYTDKVWSLDDFMIESLDPERIRGYFCFNIMGEPGGNCFNLVRILIFVIDQLLKIWILFAKSEL